jgi:hypothetical protein
MSRAKRRLGMDETDTLARLDVDGKSLLGRNSGAVEGKTNVGLKPLNAQTRTHAEGEAFHGRATPTFLHEKGCYGWNRVVLKS